MPTPTELQVDYQDISKADRNANGLMIIERIATKVKLEIKWAYVEAADLTTILNAVAPTYYNVTYLDPKSNSYKTGSFYCGDRSVGMIDYINGNPRYKDLSFDLIER